MRPPGIVWLNENDSHKGASVTPDDTSGRTAYGTGRVTAPRRLIASTASQLDRAFTIDELADAVRHADPRHAATATVYRAVAAMEASGFLVRVGQRDGATLFARCGDSARHHHHVVCDSCGKIAHAACPLPEVESGATAGFIITRHEVTLYGLCPACAGSGGGG